MKKKKLYKRLLVLAVILYASFTLINQQKVINQYSKNSDDLSSQIEEEKSTNQKLLAQKEDVNSKEYIEQTAREKLDMYYPNEKIYIDKDTNIYKKSFFRDFFIFIWKILPFFGKLCYNKNINFLIRKKFPLKFQIKKIQLFRR